MVNEQKFMQEKSITYTLARIQETKPVISAHTSMGQELMTDILSRHSRKPKW
jgi:hypothetical protein